jgi:hypothetical protein
MGGPITPQHPTDMVLINPRPEYDEPTDEEKAIYDQAIPWSRYTVNPDRILPANQWPNGSNPLTVQHPDVGGHLGGLPLDPEATILHKEVPDVHNDWGHRYNAWSVHWYIHNPEWIATHWGVEDNPALAELIFHKLLIINNINMDEGYRPRLSAFKGPQYYDLNNNSKEGFPAVLKGIPPHFLRSIEIEMLVDLHGLSPHEFAYIPPRGPMGYAKDISSYTPTALNEIKSIVLR